MRRPTERGGNAAKRLADGREAPWRRGYAPRRRGAVIARLRGSGSTGPTRSARLPLPLDDWFVERLERHRERSASEVLVQLIHGGLRLREGYMAIHRRVLERHAARDPALYAAYLECLADTFGPEYVAHLIEWLIADRVALPATTEKDGTSAPP